MIQDVTTVNRQRRLKIAARRAVRAALRAGTLQRLPCEVCNDPKVHAHHRDYSQKLIVQWLCRKHHSLAHKTRDEGMNRAAEINLLHRRVYDGLRTTLQVAIQIGELLVAQKAECDHGEWIPWIEANLSFDRTMAARYTRCYHNRARLEVLNVDSSPHLTIAEFARLKTESAKQEKKKPGDKNGALAECLKTFWNCHGNTLIEVEAVASLLDDFYAIFNLASLGAAKETWDAVRNELTPTAELYPC